MCPSSALLFLRGILLVLWAQLTLASGSHVADICRLPPETGPCLALFRRWYYNPRTRRCQTFIYGGCKGNANNFETFEECRCRCVRPREARQEKFGECPAPFKDNDVLCGELCSTDASCPGSERCCRTMCGHRCQLPLEVIPGYCPKVTLRPDWATICLASCSSDMECALGVGLPRRKCCNYGCHQLCLEAEEEHPGVCPAWRIQEPLIPCNDTCNDDRDCLLTQKCCFTGCRRACRDPVRSDRCQLPPKVGPCKARIPRYFYSPSEKKCLRFYYGGCQGNSNNFETKKACEEACGKISPEVCNLPSDPGPCYGYSEMYYYNNSTGTCEVFVYGLCGGNGNRFSTKLECMMVCGNRGKPGRCPKPTGAGICVELCSSDQDCEGRLKCCSNGCGHVCMTPIF